MHYCTLSSLRNSALAITWRRLAAKAERVDPADICRRIAEAPAPRYYVSEERAYDVLTAMRNGRQAVNSTMRRRLYDALAADVDALMRASPALSLRDAVALAVNSPAPSFFLTPGSIYVTLSIYKNVKKKHTASPAGRNNG